MKLYQCPKNSIVRLDENSITPMDSPKVFKGDTLKFHHTDGMYSYCRTMENDTVFPMAYTEVTIIGKWEGNE